MLAPQPLKLLCGRQYFCKALQSYTFWEFSLKVPLVLPFGESCLIYVQTQLPMTSFDREYWSQRWQEGQTGWDAGSATTPIREYADHLEDKELKVLIPGAGNAYEAEYLHAQGFKNVTVLDIAAEPLKNLKARVPDFPDEFLVQQDFFKHEGQYDLIIEQTFWSTFPPAMRDAYVDQMYALLKVGGALVGVLFEDELFQDHPPFGGDREEYRPHFARKFEFKYFERCHNSIPPREGRELWIHLIKPDWDEAYSLGR